MSGDAHWPLPARSSVARLQQATGVLLVVSVLGLAVWAGVSADGTLAWVLVPAGLLPVVLAVQFALATWHNRALGPVPMTWGSVVGAWWVELKAAVRRFGWRQPWRWRACADGWAGTQDAPTARRGVLLVHGYLCNRGLWSDWHAPLVQRGHPVVSVNLEPVFGPIDGYVDTLDQAVTRLTEATGLPPLVVCHSMGGLAARAWLQAVPGARARVAHIITIGTPHQGTWLARWGVGANVRQMRQGGEWLQDLARSEPADIGRQFTCWHSECDNIVFPLGTAVLPGAEARYLPGVGHVALVDHPDVLAHALALLQR